MSNLPQANGDFEWAHAAWGHALRCASIQAPHLFSTRQLSLRESGWDDISRFLGVTHVLRPRQVHGDVVALVPAPPAESEEACAAAADIIMTAHSDVAVAVQAADCVPLLFEDPRSGAVAAAHAGWRGTAAGVARRTVHAMNENFGSRAEDLVVAIGPSIGPCCYEVGEELLAAFGPDGRRWFFRLAGRWMLNLWSANRDQLVEAGVPREHVHVAELCTVNHPALFDSYRRDGTSAGRLAAAIRPGRSG